jgi:hypothetical protein
MQGIAIVTKFLGPTNTRGSRVKATTPSGQSVTIDWDHALDSEGNHNRAAARCYQKHILDLSVTMSADLAPYVYFSREIHGYKSGLVVFVGHIRKDMACTY